MPSEDKFHQEHPETNAWLERDELGHLRPKPGTSLDSYLGSKSARADAKQAAHLQKLAVDLGVDAEELAEKIPAETIRRLKFPMLVHQDADGLWHFEHDMGIVEGVRPLIGTDRGQASHPLVQPGPLRDAAGRFTK